jgi:hypothetical protein
VLKLSKKQIADALIEILSIAESGEITQYAVLAFFFLLAAQL